MHLRALLQPGRPDTGRTNLLDVLKGLAIVIFLIYHYRTNMYGAVRGLEAYGVTAVSMFFAVSGYGLYFSLRRRLAAGTPSRVLPGYYRDRLLRLYPLYLAAMAVFVLAFGRQAAWYQWLGLASDAWFINHILFCYLFSPLLYALARLKSRTAEPMVWLGVLAASVLFESLPTQARQWLGPVALYRGLFLGHLLIFYAGMRVAATRAEPWASVPGGFLGPAGLFAATCVVCGISQPVPLNWLLGLTLAYVTRLTLSTLCHRYPEGLEGLRPLGLLGRYSLAVYLFESCYYWALIRLGLLQAMNLQSAAIFVAGFPAFLTACAVASEADAWLRRGLSHAAARIPRRTGP